MATPRQYAAKSSIPTFCCTTVIFFICTLFLTKSGLKPADMTMDVFLSIGLTGLLTALIYLPLAKGTAKKGGVHLLGDPKEQSCYLFVPQSKFGYVLAMIVLPLWYFAAAPLGVLLLVAPDTVMSLWGYRIFKSLLAGATSCYACYHANLILLYLFSKSTVKQQKD